MRKAILTTLTVLMLSASMISPSQAYWKNIGGNYYWCTYGSYCR